MLQGVGEPVVGCSCRDGWHIQEFGHLVARKSEGSCQPRTVPRLGRGSTSLSALDRRTVDIQQLSQVLLTVAGSPPRCGESAPFRWHDLQAFRFVCQWWHGSGSLLPQVRRPRAAWMRPFCGGNAVLIRRDRYEGRCKAPGARRCPGTDRQVSREVHSSARRFSLPALGAAHDVHCGVHPMSFVRQRLNCAMGDGC